MSENYPRNGEAVEQEDAATWLAENYFSGEDIGEANGLGISEAVEQEDAATWLAENYFSGEDIGEASWTDYLKNIAVGAASGLAKGDLVAAATQAGLAAYQISQQPSAPKQQQAQPTSQPKAPVVATTSPVIATTPSQVVRGSQATSLDLSKQVERALREVLPSLLPKLVSELSARQSIAKEEITESTGEESAVDYEGDYIADDIYLTQSEGLGIEEPLPEEDQIQESEAEPEYPQASRFIPAKYYRRVSTPRTINRIVIHITDGGAKIEGTIGWFKNPVVKKKDGTIAIKQISAHYIVGQSGEVVQMVRNNDIAFHASSANADSIGIEHNARTPRPKKGDPGLPLTEAQYCSSAALVRWLCDQYSIPMDRAHIQGHAEADPNTTHACPGILWDWDYFMNLVISARCLPQQTS